MAKLDGTELLIQPRLLDRRRMALALCLSEDTLDGLRKRGCPCVRVPGTSKLLFNPNRVVAWLEEHPDNQDRETVTAQQAREKADAVFGT